MNHPTAGPLGPATIPLDPAAPLRRLIRLAIPICRLAEPTMPRPGPGRPDEFPEWAVAVMIVVAVAKRLTSKSAQYRFLAARADALSSRLGLGRFPARSTYFRRYAAAYLLLAEALAAHARHAAARGHVAARCAAADKTLIAAAGPPWHVSQRARGERPRGADAEASWSRSAHDGWVYGYGAEVVVSAPPRGGGPIWPLAGSLDTASLREPRTLPAKLPELPGSTRYLVVDMGYDSDDLGEAVEYDAEGRRTGRRLVGPQQVRHNARRPAKRAWRSSRRRALRHGHRRERRRFYATAYGRSLYRRRCRTVETFFGRVKDLLGLGEHAWHHGLGNNRTMALAALVLYQILLVCNRIEGRDDAEVKWRLDLL